MRDRTSDVETIFLAALEKTASDERTAYIDEACRGDVEMRARVLALLQAHEAAGSFLGKPPVDVAVTAASEDLHSPMPEETPLDFLEPCDVPGCLGTLGHYEITEVVGRGGMGIVLKGHDPKLNRVVAIKVLAPHLAVEATARRRFLREAQAAAAVSHDHVVTIHAIDDGQQLPFLVMEYVSGQSLQQRIDRSGPLELKEILRIGKQMASGLAAAHSEGLIHRDVKPANILLENSVERVKITDFGLARAANDASMTETGVVAGTPEYMSPEQAQGLAVDHRSDLFSLGCVLYAMCTGRSPFRANSAVAVIRRVCDDTPRPVQEVNSEIPDWLVRIIERLLTKGPDERLQSAAEVADLLGGHLAHLQRPTGAARPASVAPVPSQRKPAEDGPRNRLAWAAAGAIAILVAVVGLLAVFGVPGILGRPSEDLPAGPDPVGDAANGALEFDGEGDCVILPFGYDSAHPITLEAYVVSLSSNIDNVPGIEHLTGFGTILGNFADGSGGGLMITSTGYFAMLHDGERYRDVASTRFPFFREPVHLAFVFDTETIRLFCDGLLVEEKPFPSTSKRSPLTFMIGADPDQRQVTTREFKGVIDEVRISKVARYTEDFKPARRFEADADTIALYHFDEPQGNIARDSSGKDRHGTIRGATRVDMNRLPVVYRPRESDIKEPGPTNGVDLLALVEPQRDTLTPLYGNWRRERNAITVSGKWPFLQIPYLPPEEYKIVFTVERISIGSAFGIGLNLGGPTCFLRLDSWSGAECQSGLMTWDGSSFVALGETHGRQLLPCGRPRTICCEVRGSGHHRRVEATCNGQPILQWEGDVEDVTDRAPSYFLPKDDRLLTLCGFGGTFRVADLRLQAISAEGRPLLSDFSCPLHRRVAERIIWAGGVVEVSDSDGRRMRVERIDDLPEAFVLRAIDLRRVSAESTVDLEGVEKIDTLETLVLGGGQRKLPADCLQQLIRLPAVIEIDFSNTPTTDVDIESLPTDSALCKLRLDFTAITDASLLRIRGCRSLRCLTLVATQTGDEGLKRLAAMAWLEELNLRGTEVTDAGMPHLKSFRGLKRLTLDHLSITDAGLQHLHDLTELTHLSLMHTNVSDDGLQALRELKNLVEVCLVGTAVTAKGVADLQQVLPECNIVHSANSTENLMSRIDTDHPDRRGLWKLQQGALRSDAAWEGWNACLPIPWSPPGDYVLEAVVQRESGDDHVTFGLIVGGRPTSVSVDNYPYKGYRSGLRLVDGRNVAENETGLAGQVLYQGAEPTRIVMTVRGEHVTVACEDNVVVDWAGDSNRLSVHSTNAAVPDGQLFLALHKGAIRVTELKLRPIDMTTEPANPGPGTD